MTRAKKYVIMDTNDRDSDKFSTRCVARNTDKPRVRVWHRSIKNGAKNIDRFGNDTSKTLQREASRT